MAGGVGPVGGTTRTTETETRTTARPSDRRESASSVATQGTGIPIPGGATQGEMQLFALALSGALDPTTMLQAIEIVGRNEQTEMQKANLDNADVRAELGEMRKRRLLQKAERALKKAQKRMPSWARKLISAIVTAIGSVLSIFGGAGAALVAVGIVLIAAGDIVSGMAERGIIQDPKKGMIAATVCKLAGAICMFVGGITGADSTVDAAKSGAEGGKGIADATQTAQTTSDTVQTAQRVEEATKWLKVIKALIGPLSTITQATLDVVSGAHEFKAEQRKLDAEEQQLNVDDANDDRDEVVAVIKRTFERYQRIASRFAESRQINNQAQLFAAQAIA